MSVSTSSLSPGVDYVLRVALYRRLEVKDWQELLDVSNSVTISTQAPGE